jgi:chaperonin GroES
VRNARLAADGTAARVQVLADVPSAAKQPKCLPDVRKRIASVLPCKQRAEAMRRRSTFPSLWWGSCREWPGMEELLSEERLPMKIVPLGANVVVKRLPAEDVTAGGIVLPDAARATPRQGRVLSIGDGRMLADGARVPHQVSEGDRVLFDSYAGAEVVVNGEDVLIMNEDEILAIVP